MPTDSILVVDDEEDIRDLIALVLRDSGFAVTTASNGREALAILTKEKPAVTILDLMMPEMSGQEVCLAIKNDPTLKEILIIILSAKSDLHTKLKCLEMGAEEFLAKPIDMKELAMRVKRLTGLVNQWKERGGKTGSDSIAVSPLLEKTAPTVLRPTDASSVPEPPVAAEEEPKAQKKSVYGVYRIERKAGTGGMGQVYKAHDQTLDRYVAVKILSKQWSSFPEFLERFRREAKAIATIDHPGIAQIYTFGEEADEPYFALQWCPGGSLSNLIQRQEKIELLPAIDIILQCARALDAALAKGVVHRDIKPSNLMFDENQQIKIVDFGVAFSKKMPEKSGGGWVMGSPSYMAPEQAKGIDADHRVDIYSLGITFYYMLYGHLPFSAETSMQLLTKQISAPFPEYDSLNGTIPPSAYQIIEKMTQKLPGGRYARYSELIRDLERLRNELYSQHRLKIATAVQIAPVASWKGDNLFEILSDIFRSGSSGLLKASWGRLQKKFLIAQNQLVRFESPQSDEDVWMVLVRRDLMKPENIPPTGEDLEESLNRLLFLQAFTPENFKTAYRETMADSLLQVFQWPVFEGEFFKATIEHEAYAPVSLSKILMTATRLLIPFEKIQDLVPANLSIVRTGRFEDVLKSVDLSRAESFLASRLDGGNVTLETLQFLTGFPLELISRTVHALNATGAIMYRSTAERQPRRKTESGPVEIPTSVPDSIRPIVMDVNPPPSPPASQPASPPESRKDWIETPHVRDPKEGIKHYAAAEEKYKSGLYWEASRRCLLAIQNDPDEAKYHHLMALALLRYPHSIKVAEEAFLQAIHLAPENLQYRLDFATFLKDQGRFDAAYDECESILDTWPKDRGALRLRVEIEKER